MQCYDLMILEYMEPAIWNKAMGNKTICDTGNKV